MDVQQAPATPPQAHHQAQQAIPPSIKIAREAAIAKAKASFKKNSFGLRMPPIEKAQKCLAFPDE
jgi:hypothetical protein